MNAAGLDLLTHYEGFRANAYLCPAGVPTIGYGFTKGVKLGDKITPDEAKERLLKEVSEFENNLGVTGTENQIAALTCLAYNIGLGAFKGSTVLRKHTQGLHEVAADAFLMWNLAGGHILPGLVRRRHAERELYLS